MGHGRQRVAGADAVEAALDAETAVRCVVLPETADDPRCGIICGRSCPAGAANMAPGEQSAS